ncbi:MAG TPA: hypothetical protein PKX78_00740 [Candidatus Woesebacteria bacterium]|mgnify:CR=1 FL=1|nr:hypothetical protein [Candidatus Woesebacteria bacterium]
MFGSYLLFFLGTWVISQSVKFFVKILRREITLKETFSSYLFYSGPPSSHTALLVMTLFFVYSRDPEDQILLITFMCFTILWLYEIYMQRKRFVLLAHSLSDAAIKNPTDKNWAKKNARVSWSCFD